MQTLIDREQVSKILDLGSGDGMLTSHLDLHGKKYVGIDASNYAIEKATMLNKGVSTRFILADARSYRYSGFDLIICKDVLQHLSNESVLRILKKVQKNNRLAIFVNDAITGVKQNHDIRDGEYRPLDILLPPFNFFAREVMTYESSGFNKTIHLFQPSYS